MYIQNKILFAVVDTEFDYGHDIDDVVTLAIFDTEIDLG